MQDESTAGRERLELVAGDGDDTQLPGATPPEPPEPEQPATPPAPEPEPEPGDTPPTLPGGRLKLPEDTRGHYVVLWAAKPPRGTRPSYQEAACVKAHDGEQAKRLVLEEDGRTPRPHEERGEVARFLLERAQAKPGILLRAVPAMHWPQDVDTTTFERPAPVLRIG